MTFTDVEKCNRLSQLVQEPGLNVIMEAHDGLSARIVQASGFDGIWASGLTMSSALGVRDCNEASWTEMINLLEYMADGSSIPILFDGDSGYGNFNNVRRLVRRLGQSGGAGVVIEDKLFPKLNSFAGPKHSLAEVDEFCGRIRAATDNRLYDNFQVIARTEALIAGQPLEEALQRAHRYVEAGADAIFIHSKLGTPSQIIEFTKLWQGRAPLVIAPTTYSETPFQVFADIGISLCICANHNLRAAAKAMMKISQQIRSQSSIAALDDTTLPLKDLFALLDYGELEEAKVRYGAIE